MTIHDDELMQELLQTFHAEAADHLQTLNQDLLQLERQPDESQRTALIQEAFRTAHSLKGAARAVALADIEQLAHHVEDILKLARDEQKPLDAATCDILYNTLDAIQSILNNGTPDVDALLHDLQSLLPAVPNGHHANGNGTHEIEQPKPIEHENGAHNGNGNGETRFADNDESIRVTVSKLDALMAQAGELIVTRISAEQRVTELQTIRQKMGRFPRIWQEVRSRLSKVNTSDDSLRNFVDALDDYHEAVEGLLSDVSNVDTLLNRDSLRLGMVAERLQDEMRRVRMVPFRNLEALLHRTVRDAARTMNKQAALTIEGGDVELDKKVLELLKDPLLHLVRNSVGHGIEAPEEREKSGKHPEGHITIEITQRGSEAHLAVSDDGRGFQLEALKQVSKAHASVSTDEDVIALAFMPGVTTASDVNAILGRGVGLDVVRQQVENLQGRISVDNRPGQGVSIHIIVPVSLAMTRVLLVAVGNKHYALPLAAVEKIVSPEKTFSVEGQVMLTVDDKPLPLVALSHLLHDHAITSDEPLVIVLGSAEQRVAVMVDDVLTEQELAVKPFTKPLKRVRNLVGAALKGNGEPVVVLNVADVVKSARNVRVTSVMPVVAKDAKAENIQYEHILVVDDSITTRTLEKNILKAAGYTVETATDGLEALDALRLHDIQLVVADVEMPNMDGITLTRHLRESENYQDLPIILVTSLESKEDRERGMMAGANAYIVKRGFNQSELLSTIRQLL